jgi:two-component system OmpR family sensor kinase
VRALLRRLAPGTLRGRITAVYAVGLAVVVGAGLLIGYAALAGQLRAAATDDLMVRLGDMAAAVQAGDLAPVLRDPYAQLLASGSVAAHSAAAPTTPMITRAELARAADGQLLVRRPEPGLGVDALVGARRLPDGRVVVVGSSLATVNAAARRVLTGLAVTGPALVLVLTLAVRRLVDAALGPVAALTAEALALTTTEPDRRLPEPPGTDEIATLARTLNGMLDRIDAAHQRERAFLDDAAHELRTPVAVLRAELELGLTSADPEAARQALRGAVSEADRLSRLAADLLVLARARAGTLELDRRPTDVTAVVREAAGRFARLRPIAVEVSGEELVAEVDGARLEQIVTNLVGNAVQAGAQLVRLRVEQSAAGLTLTVDDDGPGFAPDLTPFVFDRFSRGASARTRDEPGGAGLGLAIVAAVARAHGGHAEASNDSALGGARLRVVLG